MQYIRFLITFITIFLIGQTVLNAQETITTTGSDAEGSNGTASYTIGQIAYGLYVGTNGSVTEGVQQAYEISEITVINETDQIPLSLSVYPNPTDDLLLLEIKKLDHRSLCFQLFDIRGNLIQEKKITSFLTYISMSNLSSGNYFLKVLQNSFHLRTFQINKL